MHTKFWFDISFYLRFIKILLILCFKNIEKKNHPTTHECQKLLWIFIKIWSNFEQYQIPVTYLISFINNELTVFPFEQNDIKFNFKCSDYI